MSTVFGRRSGWETHFQRKGSAAEWRLFLPRFFVQPKAGRGAMAGKLVARKLGRFFSKKLFRPRRREPSCVKIVGRGRGEQDQVQDPAGTGIARTFLSQKGLGQGGPRHLGQMASESSLWPASAHHCQCCADLLAAFRLPGGRLYVHARGPATAVSKEVLDSLCWGAAVR